MFTKRLLNREVDDAEISDKNIARNMLLSNNLLFTRRF